MIGMKDLFGLAPTKAAFHLYLVDSIVTAEPRKSMNSLAFTSAR